MSTVTFGKSQPDINSGESIDRLFGTFSWGEPTKFYLFDLLLKYLPKFVKQNDVVKNLMLTIAITMVKWESKTIELPMYELQGGKASLKYANEDCQIFASSKITDSNLVYAINNFFAIHEKRGTAAGILEDIKRLTNDDSATIAFKGYEECGWFLDVTFPEYNTPTQLGLESPCFLDLDNLLIVKYRNKSGLSDYEVSKIIREEFIPLVMNVREFVAKEHVIMFNEEVDGSIIQFGNFNWGDTTE